MLDVSPTSQASLAPSGTAAQGTYDHRVEVRPSSGEAPFAPHEVLFSRTDMRGVIQSGNYVFKRTANLDWSELLGAPHKTIRHEDMPKGVFWLFWDTLKKNLPIGAYVKNRARDGLHYWVFACAIPCQGGYLSARIKPTSAMLDTVKKEYEALVELERTGGLGPEESAARFLARLPDLGFDNYHQFESSALAAELLSRNAVLEQAPDERIVRFQSMLRVAQNLKDATENLVREFQTVQIIPHNMRVMASRLEPTGGPFHTLSSNYGAMSSEISTWFESNVVGENSIFATISDSVNSSMFIDGLVGILDQCDSQLMAERRELDEIDVEAEREILGGIVRDFSAQSLRQQATIVDEARRIQIACKTMSRHVLGLSTTRVMCKIESARMGLSGEGLSDIISQLGRFQEKIGNQLKDIGKMGEEIQELARRPMEGAKTARPDGDRSAAIGTTTR